MIGKSYQSRRKGDMGTNFYIGIRTSASAVLRAYTAGTVTKRCVHGVDMVYIWVQGEMNGIQLALSVELNPLKNRLRNQPSAVN